MRVVIFLGYNNPRIHKRGPENVIDIQAKALGPNARKFYIFFDERPSVFRWGDIVCIGIQKGLTKFLKLNAIAFRLFRAAKRKNDSAIIHSHYPQMSLMLYRNTELLTVHDGLLYMKECFDQRYLFNARYLWVFRIIEKLAYLRTKRVHCNSHFTYAQSQLSKIGKCAIVIYCSTPMERLQSVKGVRAQTSRTRKLSFSVRSMEPRARIDLVVEIAAQAQEQSLDIDFVIAGKGPLLEHYRQVAQERKLGNLQLIGYVSDEELAIRYRECDCVLVPSEYAEGFGIPIIEGYLFGKPVVASDRCAIPEIIIDPKYLSVNNADIMLKKLNATLTEPYCAKRYVDHYRRKFSNAVFCEQFSKLYDEVFD